MNHEVVIAGVGVIATCIIGVWPFWRSIESKREKLILVLLMGSASAISLFFIYRELVPAKKTASVIKDPQPNPEKGAEIMKNWKFKAVEGWKRDDKSTINIETTENEPRDAEYFVKEGISTAPYLLPRIRIWWRDDKEIMNLFDYMNSIKEELPYEYKNNARFVKKQDDGRIIGVMSNYSGPDEKYAASMYNMRLIFYSHSKEKVYFIIGTSKDEYASYIKDGVREFKESL